MPLGFLKRSRLESTATAFLLVGHELVGAFGVGLLKTLHRVAIFFDEGAARDHDVHRKRRLFDFAHLGEFVHAEAESLR